MGYMPKVPANGSVYVKNGGFEYTGVKGEDPNQVMTYDEETKAVGPTDLDALMGGACVSILQEDEPKERPRGGDLQRGDFWTNEKTMILSIWDDEDEDWKYVNAINGIFTGAILFSIYTSPTAIPPEGYLKCDGSPCPSEFGALRDLLQEQTGTTDLPALPEGNLIKT